MSHRHSDTPPFDSHHLAEELRNAPEHAHAVGEQHGKGDHLTDHEHSRLATEHNHEPWTGNGIATFGHKDIARLAYEMWEARGCPGGSPDEDWLSAVKELRSRFAKQ